MIVKVFNRDGYMVIDRDNCETDMLAQFFSWAFSPPNVVITNTDTGGQWTFVTTEIRDIDGNLVGNQAAVDAYFTTEQAKQIVPTPIPPINIGDITVNTNPTQLDAAGRQPVSQDNILGSYVMDVNDLPYLLDRKGTGTQTYSNGRVGMSVTAGQYAVCQSYKVHPYFAGQSHSIEITFDEMNIQADVVKKIGLFDSVRSAPYNSDLDGFYLEMDGSTYNFVIANANTGLEVRIPQSNWDNQDDLPDLDLSKFNVMSIDFLYLGGTQVRLFFYLNGKFTLFHTYKHAGVIAGTIVQSPTLPVRWEIRSSTGSGTLGQICADVSSSGEVQLIGTQVSTPTSTNRVNANNAGVAYMLKAIRLNPTIGLDKGLLSLSAAAMCVTNDDQFVAIYINPTVAGSPLTWIDMQDENGNNLGIQYADPDITGNPSTTTVTGGMQIFGQYMGDRVREIKTDGVALNRGLGIDLDGNVDIMVLTVEPLPGGTNADVYGVLTATIN